jgi:hypothetical protein
MRRYLAAVVDLARSGGLEMDRQRVIGGWDLGLAALV